MFKNTNDPKRSRNQACTIIGAGMRIDGNIDFSGVLRVQGDIVGDVAAPAGAAGTIVVDPTGSITGKVAAANIVVRGRVCGPTHSGRLLEVQRSGSVVGSTLYQKIDVQLGGRIEGVLMPGAPAAAPENAAASLADSAAAVIDTAALDECVMAPPESRPAARRGGIGKWGWGLALLAAALVVGWLNRNPAAAPPVSTQAPDSAVSSESAAAPAVAPEPIRPAAEPSGQAAAVPAATAPVPVPAPAPTPTPERAELPAPDLNRVVKVEGLNPAKSAGVVFLITREPSVLFKKKRDDRSEGTRIEVSQGRNRSIQIAENELLRVADGRALEVFYQGRKVAPKTVESGVWMSFVPLRSGDGAAR